MPFRAILKVPSLAGIVILASGRPAPVLLRTRRRIPPVLPYTPRLMRLFSFPRVFDFSIFSFSRPSPANRPLATRNFSSSLSPGLCRARPRKASTPRHFFPCRPPADCFLIMFFRCRRSRSRPDGASFSVAFRSLSVSLFPRTFALPVNAAQSPPDFPLRSAPLSPFSILFTKYSVALSVQYNFNPVVWQSFLRNTKEALSGNPESAAAEFFPKKFLSRIFDNFISRFSPFFFVPPCSSPVSLYPPLIRSRSPFSLFCRISLLLKKETQNFLSPLGI